MQIKKVLSLKVLLALLVFISIPLISTAASWSDNLIFYAPFTDPTNPLEVRVGSGQFTFKRVSSATYIYPGTDIVTMSAENTIPQSEDMTTTWIASSSSVVADQAVAPDGLTTADEFKVGAAGDGSREHFIIIQATSTSQINASQIFTASTHVKANTNTWIALGVFGKNGVTSRCFFNTSTGAVGTCTASTTGSSVASTNGFYRFSVSGNVNTGAATTSVRLYLANGDNVSSWTGDGAKSVYVWGTQLNSGPAVTPYIKTTTDFASAPRIENGGILIEGTRTNLLLWSRDMSTSTAWVRTNATVSKTETGHDGVSNSASRVTASANNATICQTVTTSATSSASVDIKRISGTGSISLSLDGGSTYGPDVSGSLSTSVWYRAAHENKLVVNPTFCIKLGSSGDEFALDYAQVEVGGTPSSMTAANFISSRIPTTYTTATRYIERLSIPSAGNWPTSEGSFFVIGDTWDTAHANKFVLDGTDPARVILHIRSGQGVGSAGTLGRTTIYDGSSECSYTTVNVQPQTPTKMATRWSATAGLRGSTASGGVPTNCVFDGSIEIISPMVFGDSHAQDGTRTLWGHLKEARIYSSYFNDTMIQSATLGESSSIGSTPNAPASVTVATTSSSSASLSWATPTNDGGSSISDYLIQYKIGAGATSTWAHAASTATSTTITGLASATGYTFYVSAINETGTGTPAIGFGTTTSGVVLDTTAPIISSVASSTTQTNATITWSTDESASSAIQYGLTTSYGTVASSSATSSHSVTLSGLTAGTLYNYKIFATDSSGNMSSSTNYTFTTAALTVTSPTVTQQSASSISTSSATLNGTIVSNNNASSTVRGFEYGLTTSYGSTASTTGTYGTGSYSQTITGLTSNVLYYYRAFAINSAGTGTSTYGTFTTLSTDITPPIAGSVATSTTDTTATITWSTNEAASSSILYGLTTGYGNISATSTANTTHSMVLTGLTQDTAYNFSIVSVDSSQNAATSTNYTFRTLVTVVTPTPTPVAEIPRVTYGGSSGGNTGSYTPVSAPQPVAQSRSEKVITKNLKIGDDNLEVKKLQKILNALGFVISAKGNGSTGKEITYFGPGTKAAVIKFQKKYKIDPIGLVGPATRAKILELAK